ncbi:MAG: helix-turn-helix transcriptional regulator [Clostridia bacterium]|jgi:transcriptional regulator with XRE-family HTH domain|nr:helix-turn-helix transcriptional regulator [Clostridia bacterium]
MIEQEIGRRIKEIRKQKKIPQEKLAEMIGISPNYMSALERGAYNIKLELLVQIIDCLDITADDLFRDVIKNGYVNRTSRLSDEIATLPAEEQQRIFEVLDALLRTARRK